MHITCLYEPWHLMKSSPNKTLVPSQINDMRPIKSFSATFFFDKVYLKCKFYLLKCIFFFFSSFIYLFSPWRYFASFARQYSCLLSSSSHIVENFHCFCALDCCTLQQLFHFTAGGCNKCLKAHAKKYLCFSELDCYSNINQLCSLF